MQKADKENTLNIGSKLLGFEILSVLRGWYHLQSAGYTSRCYHGHQGVYAQSICFKK